MINNVSSFLSYKAAYKFKQHDDLIIDSDELKYVRAKYNGLCELISNYVLMQDMLGKQYTLPPKELPQITAWENDAEKAFHEFLKSPRRHSLGGKQVERARFFFCYSEKNPKPYVTPVYSLFINSQNLQYMTDTHILHMVSWVACLMALFFSVYPCDLFANQPKPYRKNQQGNATVDKNILLNKLNSLQDGTSIKFFTFKKGFFTLAVHSMLIKKINGEKYSFFDPDHGAFNDLNFDALTQVLDHIADKNQAHHMVFIDAEQFVKTFNIRERMEQRANNAVDLFAPKACFA